MIDKQDITRRIIVALDKIRPFLQKDEGDIAFIELTDNLEAKVELLGACKTCQFSDQTLQSGVVDYIKREAPEVKKVIAL